MPENLPATRKYKYLIRPDGSIRVATKGNVRPRDDDHVVVLSQRHLPGKSFWDFKTGQMLEYTEEQVLDRKRAIVAATEAEDADRASRRAELADLLEAMPSNQARAFRLLAELNGLDLE